MQVHTEIVSQTPNEVIRYYTAMSIVQVFQCADPVFRYLITNETTHLEIGEEDLPPGLKYLFSRWAHQTLSVGNSVTCEPILCFSNFLQGQINKTLLVQHVVKSYIYCLYMLCVYICLQVKETSNDVHMHSLSEFEGLLLETGYNKPLTTITIDDKKALLSAMADYYCLLKVKAATDQFASLECTGVLKYHQDSWSLAKSFASTHAL